VGKRYGQYTPDGANEMTRKMRVWIGWQRPVAPKHDVNVVGGVDSSGIRTPRRDPLTGSQKKSRGKLFAILPTPTTRRKGRTGEPHWGPSSGSRRFEVFGR